MANPKRRHSHGRTRRRRAHQKYARPTLSSCPTCDEAVRPHHVCSYCGRYKGETVVETANG